MKRGIPQRDRSALLVIDVQQKLKPVISGQDKILRNIRMLVHGARILGLETIITEQYPKGLGATCPELELPADASVFEKNTFSCLLDEKIDQRLKLTGKTELIVCGVESHICVLKTVLDALKEGYTVHVVADAVSSRTLENKEIALKRMAQAGAYIVSVEMILFMMLDHSGSDEFKAISKLIK